MAGASQSDHVPLYYLITYPRTCSNLFVRMLALEDQPNVFPAPDYGGYFFKPYFTTLASSSNWGMPIDELPAEQVASMRESLKSCADTFGEYVAKARSQRAVAFVKEHAHFISNPVAESKYLHGPESTNQELWTADPSHAAFNEEPAEDGPSSHSPGNMTVLPDRFLKAWKPTFLIRHPAAAFPSFYRSYKDIQNGQDPSDNAAKLLLTLHWPRTLYDWYVRQIAEAQHGALHQDEDASWPIVLDADDIMAEPAVVVRYCEIVGLDPAKLKFEWEVESKETIESMHTAEKRMLSTLLASSGINKSKLSTNISIEEEAVKWREEFGEEQGKKIEMLVRDAMPGYEYLKSKRLRPANQ